MHVIARGEEHPLVLDPRLSTTYDAHGDAATRRRRALARRDDDESDQWSRRVAGVATGSIALDQPTARSLTAHALHCVSRGEPAPASTLLLR